MRIAGGGSEPPRFDSINQGWMVSVAIFVPERACAPRARYLAPISELSIMAR